MGKNAYQLFKTYKMCEFKGVLTKEAADRAVADLELDDETELEFSIVFQDELAERLHEQFSADNYTKSIRRLGTQCGIPTKKAPQKRSKCAAGFRRANGTGPRFEYYRQQREAKKAALKDFADWDANESEMKR